MTSGSRARRPNTLPPLARFASLALAALLASNTSAAQRNDSRSALRDARPQAPASELLQPIERWFASVKRSREGVRGEHAAELEPLVADLRILHVTRPELRPEIAAAFLELAALAPRGPERRVFGPTPAERASDLGFAGLHRALDLDESGESAAWLSARIAGDPQTRAPLALRLAAIDALRGRRIAATLPALAAAVEDPDVVVRDAALGVLSGWDDPEAHRLMITQWSRLKGDPRWSRTRAVERHFAQVTMPAGSPLERALLDSVRTDLVSPDWRAALRALRTSEGLRTDVIAPAWIEALAMWANRRRAGEESAARLPSTAPPRGSVRIENEFTLALQRRSGKNIGPHPERWSRWWRTSRDAAPSEGEAQQQVTRASFYGLRPVTDRVCFIVDRSGSMNSAARDGHSRYHEALTELERFITALGPSTRFRVVLFSDDVHVWKPSLVYATPAAVGEALHWAAERQPKGGTELRPAIEHVLRLGRDGEPDLDKLEEDTVIVLCDGATAEGPGWVEPLIERVGPLCCVAFHCVQIGGGGGDGVLRQLAERSGGDYVESGG